MGDKKEIAGRVRCYSHSVKSGWTGVIIVPAEVWGNPWNFFGSLRALSESQWQLIGLVIILQEESGLRRIPKAEAGMQESIRFPLQVSRAGIQNAIRSGWDCVIENSFRSGQD